MGITTGNCCDSGNEADCGLIRVGSCNGPRTNYPVILTAMKLSMMVLITSSTPNRLPNSAAIHAHAAPAAAPTPNNT